LWMTTGVGGAAISRFAELGSELPKMICGRFSAGSFQYSRTGNDELSQSLPGLMSRISPKQSFQRGYQIAILVALFVCVHEFVD
jgi:hypothetical protein